MPRRGKGEGTIRERADGRWEAIVTLPQAGGARRRKSFFGKTRAEVAKKLTAGLKALNDGVTLPNGRRTVGGFLAEWLEGKRHEVRPESFRRYGDAVRLHLTPELGNVVLTRLTPIEVQSAYVRLRAKGLSGTTLQLVHGVLHTALAAAMRWDLVQRNVAELVDAPRRSTGEMRTLSPDEASRLMTAAQGDPLEAFYVLALTSGLRLGELQALRWRNVDLDRRRLQVVATYQGNEDGEPVFAEPKTDGSRRTVHLTEIAAVALRAHRSRQLEQRLKAGPVWRDYDLAFTNAFGGALDGNNLRRRSFARLLERAGLPPMRFHALRHAVATLLMAEGVPVKAISEMLGHSDITTTLRIYAHVLPSTQEAAAQAMDRLLGERKGAMVVR